MSLNLDEELKSLSFTWHSQCYLLLKTKQKGGGGGGAISVDFTFTSSLIGKVVRFNKDLFSGQVA